MRDWRRRADGAPEEPGFEQLSLFAAASPDRAAPAPVSRDPGDPDGERLGGRRPAGEWATGPFADCRDLDELARIAAGCRRCGLRDGCRGVVFGEGDPAARLMLVGEGPGATEDELGRPFVGRAGQLLDRILAAIGFRREQVYITNAVKCRPPNNRTPTEAEIRTCLPYLYAQIRLINPAIIVCLGSTAVRALIHPQARITRIRGIWQERWGLPIMPTYHPAAVLRDPAKKRPVWEDFKAVRRRYQELTG